MKLWLNAECCRIQDEICSEKKRDWVWLCGNILNNIFHWNIEGRHWPGGSLCSHSRTASHAPQCSKFDSSWRKKSSSTSPNNRQTSWFQFTLPCFWNHTRGNVKGQCRLFPCKCVYYSYLRPLSFLTDVQAVCKITTVVCEIMYLIEHSVSES